MESAKVLADGGIGAIVLHSLFEEQLIREEMSWELYAEAFSHSHPEAASYLPDPEDATLGPDQYLRHLERLKAAVEIPVLASLNGTTPGGWLHYARLMEEAGADGLELNVSRPSTRPR